MWGLFMLRAMSLNTCTYIGWNRDIDITLQGHNYITSIWDPLLQKEVIKNISCICMCPDVACVKPGCIRYDELFAKEPTKKCVVSQRRLKSFSFKVSWYEDFAWIISDKWIIHHDTNENKYFINVWHTYTFSLFFWFICRQPKVCGGDQNTN